MPLKFIATESSDGVRERERDKPEAALMKNNAANHLSLVIHWHITSFPTHS